MSSPLPQFHRRSRVPRSVAKPSNRVCTHHDVQRRRGQPLHPLGVTWNVFKRLWSAMVTRQGRIHKGGDFDDLDDAIEALEALRLRLR
jgi:hypothetical protein